MGLQTISSKLKSYTNLKPPISSRFQLPRELFTDSIRDDVIDHDNHLQTLLIIKDNDTPDDRKNKKQLQYPKPPSTCTHLSNNTEEESYNTSTQVNKI